MRFFTFVFLLLLGTRSVAALPSDELFEALRTAPTVQHAQPLEDDILAAMKESGSPTADLVYERASIAAAAGEIEMARELLDRVLVIKPDFSEAWLFRATLYLQEDALDQALRDINDALVHEKRNFRAWGMLGRIFEQLEQNKEALEAYNEALKIHPHYESAVSAAKRLETLVNGREI